MEDDAVYELGSIVPIKAYQATIGVVFALAILSYITSSAVKIKARHFLFADELLLLLAVVSLIPCTAFAFVGADTFYRDYAVLRDPALITNPSADTYNSLGRMGFVWFSSFTFCAWTTIFYSKAYMLRISWHLLRKLPWIREHFWGVLICTGIFWAVVCAAAFILQPYDYFEPDSYFGHGSDVLFLTMSGLTTGLDVVTSLMIALILYIKLLRSGTSKAHRHFVLLSWVILSATVLFTILRVCRLYDAVHVDVVWIVLWHYLEAGTPIIGYSIASFQAAASVHRQSMKAQQDIGIHEEAHMGVSS